MEPQNEVWKMIFLFQRGEFSGSMLVFEGVASLIASLQSEGFGPA